MTARIGKTTQRSARKTKPGANQARKPKRPANPRGQRLQDGRTVTTTSTFSPRLLGLRDQLDSELRRLFGNRVEAVTAYNVHGWRIQRPVTIPNWKGTIDPNFVHVGVAERKAGITLFLWNPAEPQILRLHAEELAAAGFKVMVGCLQFNRKSAFPLDAVVPILTAIRKTMAARA